MRAGLCVLGGEELATGTYRGVDCGARGFVLMITHMRYAKNSNTCVLMVTRSSRRPLGLFFLFLVLTLDKKQEEEGYGGALTVKVLCEHMCSCIKSRAREPTSRPGTNHRQVDDRHSPACVGPPPHPPVALAS